MRERMTGLGWVFIASPLLILAFGQGRYSLAETAFMPILGAGILLWLRRRPAPQKHVAGVEFVRPDDYRGPGAKLAPFYLAWCDCGWSGDDQQTERAARADAHEHTDHVLPGLNPSSSSDTSRHRAERGDSLLSPEPGDTGLASKRHRPCDHSPA